MSKDDTGGGGLLSKVVKFVRSPGSGWTDAEQDSGQESSYSKQMLKEMIERKRRNDFVRKREFDMLRKMRRSEVMAGTDPAARPSFFQSSLPSRPDDRATTLKKIDEIEAQMSMQWWKNKNGSGGNGSSTNFPISQHGAPEPPAAVPPMPLQPSNPDSYARTQEMPLGGAVAEPAGKDLPPLEYGDLVLDFTKGGAEGAPSSSSSPALPPILVQQPPHASTAPAPMRMP